MISTSRVQPGPPHPVEYPTRVVSIAPPRGDSATWHSPGFDLTTSLGQIEFYVLRRSAVIEAREPLIPEASTHEKLQLYLKRIKLTTIVSK